MMESRGEFTHGFLLILQTILRSEFSEVLVFFSFGTTNSDVSQGSLGNDPGQQVVSVPSVPDAKD